MYRHLSPLGNISKINIETTQLKSSINNILVPLEIITFKPDKKSQYYRYITNKLGLIIQELSQIQSEEILFDFVIFSRQQNPELIQDIKNIIQDIVDIGGYIEDEYLCFSVFRNNIEYHYLSLYIRDQNHSLNYNSTLTVPLLQLIPITYLEYIWIQNNNTKWGDKLGSRIFREWLEYRQLIPLGTDVNTSILRFDTKNLNNMINEIGKQFLLENEDEWYTEQLNFDYCQVFQNFIHNNVIGNVDVDIEQGGLLISTCNYNEAIKYYNNLIQLEPKNKTLYIEQIGVAYFFKKDFYKAKDCYIQAIDSGSKTLDFNLWEVCHLLSKKENNKLFLKEYIKYFPNGFYIKNIDI